MIVKDPKELSSEELKSIRELIAPVCFYPKDVIHADYSHMKYGEKTTEKNFLDIAGRVEVLTNSEAEYIKTFSPDTFRDRIAQIRSEN